VRISDSHRLVFVHVEKTGGASIERILDRNIDDLRFDPSKRHASLATLLGREPQLTDYWIFGFVRNPWARMVSWWSMIERSAKRADEGSDRDIRKFATYPDWSMVRAYGNFETFVRRGTEDLERYRTPQIEMLSTPERRADFIGRTETIDADVNVIRKRLGVRARAKMPHRHRGIHGHYRDYYTPETRDIIAELYKPDIDEFGYDF
jgi:Sulfotransferase family